MRAGRAWFFLAAAAGITRAEISPNREAPAHPIEPSVSELGVRSYVLVLTAATKHDDRVVGGIICAVKAFNLLDGVVEVTNSQGKTKTNCAECSMRWVWFCFSPFGLYPPLH